MTAGVILRDVRVTTSCETALILPLRQTRNRSTERLRKEPALPAGGGRTDGGPRPPQPGWSWSPAHARHEGAQCRPCPQWLEDDLDFQGHAQRYVNDQKHSMCFEYGLGFPCFQDLAFKHLKHLNAFRFLKKNQRLRARALWSDERDSTPAETPSLRLRVAARLCASGRAPARQDEAWTRTCVCSTWGGAGRTAPRPRLLGTGLRRACPHLPLRSASYGGIWPR